MFEVIFKLMKYQEQLLCQTDVKMSTLDCSDEYDIIWEHGEEKFLMKILQFVPRNSSLF